MKPEFRYTCALCALLLLLMLTPALRLTAQEEPGTTRGRDFLLSFLPNFHELGSEDSLYIFIVAEEATGGEIRYRDRDGNDYTEAFQITNPAEPWVFSLGHAGFALLGFNDGGITIHNNQSDGVGAQSFRVIVPEARPEVAVFGMSKALHSGDAFAVLPVAALDTAYYVMAYNSDGRQKPGGNNQITGRSTPSQFCIVAAYDNTQVQVRLSTTRTWPRAGSERSVTLQRGEVFLLQASMDTQDSARLAQDLSGSYVRASRPVAVFGGQQRAELPDLNSLSPNDNLVAESRSFLQEQIPPNTLWGKSVLLLPFPEPRPPVAGRGNDLFRIMATRQDTRIFIDGEFIANLNAGEIYQDALTAARHIVASEPVLAVQYKKSSSRSINEFRHSDPFMMVMTPAEQFAPAHTWYTMEASEGGAPIVDMRYAAIIAPDVNLHAVQLDGVNIPTGDFQPIGISGYSYAIRELAPGIHSARADSGIGVYTFAYGEGFGWGTAAGMLVDDVGRLPDTLRCTLRLSETEASPGGTFALHVIVDSLEVPLDILQKGLESYRGRIRFNSTLFSPANPQERGTISQGYHFLDVTGAFRESLQNGDTLLSIACTAGLGDAEGTEIFWEGFAFFDTAGDSVLAQYTLSDGFMRLRDIWRDERGPRLVNPRPGALLLEIDPNPASEQTTFRVQGNWSALGGRLQIIDATGRELADLSTELLALPDSGSITFDIRSYNRGVYYCRLSVGPESIVRAMILE